MAARTAPLDGSASAVKRPNWQPEATDATRLERLSRSQDPVVHLEHSADLVRVLCEAYFSGRLAPLRFHRADEELLLAMGAKALDVAGAAQDACISTVNLAALGIKRIALETCRRVGLGTGKALLIETSQKEAGEVAAILRNCLVHIDELVDAELCTQLSAPSSEDGRGNEDDQPHLGSLPESLCLRASAVWRYPVEVEVGELLLHWKSISGQSGTQLADACRISAQCLHQWHRQEWMQAESLTEPQDVDVRLVGTPPCPSDVEVQVRLWDSAMTGFGRSFCQGSARLPPLREIGASGRQMRLPLRDLHAEAVALDCCACLELTAAWHFPIFTTRADGTEVEQRGRGLLKVSELRVLNPGSHGNRGQEIKVEILVFHRVNEVSTILQPGVASCVLLPVKLKQNRPETKKSKENKN
eukprot:TRINITY_DN88312_c0_g1_i1.p1 TRINITY_DN88312_c0_g1~~TRINITY_DN88312_c0_g1_i1.p1  ORF type:complete len:427 (+),score=53.39 TRINITY_DN88312_c0_g1_i1:38-1282(+)